MRVRIPRQKTPWLEFAAAAVAITALIVCVVMSAKPARAQDPIPYMTEVEPDAGGGKPAAAPAKPIGARLNVPGRRDVNWAGVRLRGENGRESYTLSWPRNERLLLSRQVYGFDFRGIVPHIRGPVTIWGNGMNPGQETDYGIAAGREWRGDSANAMYVADVELTGKFTGAAMLIDCMEIVTLERMRFDLQSGVALELCNDDALRRRMLTLKLPAEPAVLTHRRTCSRGLVASSALASHSTEPGARIVWIRGEVTHWTFRDDWFASSGADVALIERLPLESWRAGAIGAVSWGDGARANIPQQIEFENCVFEGSGWLKGKKGVIRLGPGVPRSAVLLTGYSDQYLTVVESDTAISLPPIPTPEPKPAPLPLPGKAPEGQPVKKAA